jgi:hypothetical protein
VIELGSDAYSYGLEGYSCEKCSCREFGDVLS